MFQKDDLVFYGNVGVCRVEEIGKPPSTSPVDGDKLYYKLSPLYDTSEIYIPVDTKMFMRPVISRQEAEELIRQIPAIREDDYASDKRMEMAEHYRGFLNSHTCEDLMCLMKTLYQRGQQSIQRGRNPGAMEQDFKKRAEGLLYGELAVVLGVPVEEVEGYISQRIEEAGAAQV